MVQVIRCSSPKSYTKTTPSWHFASSWSIHDSSRSAEEVTALGKALLRADGGERERIQLELLHAFHPYLSKYLDMIVRGHLPTFHGRVKPDTRKFLSLLIPKGTATDRLAMSKACRHLHLAFKGCEPAEIYNVLAAILLKMVDKYDPDYTEKVRKVVNAIKAMRRTDFTSFQVNAPILNYSSERTTDLY